MATEQKEQLLGCEEKKEETEKTLKWLRVPKIVLPTSTFRNSDVYQSEAEMNAAIKDGTFELRKTMIIRNGRLFFLCHK